MLHNPKHLPLCRHAWRAVVVSCLLTMKTIEARPDGRLHDPSYNDDFLSHHHKSSYQSPSNQHTPLHSLPLHHRPGNLHFDSFPLQGQPSDFHPQSDEHSEPEIDRLPIHHRPHVPVHKTYDSVHLSHNIHDKYSVPVRSHSPHLPSGSPQDNYSPPSLGNTYSAPQIGHTFSAPQIGNTYSPSDDSYEESLEHHDHSHDYDSEEAKYSFNYKVEDPYSGTNFGHEESRDNHFVKGHYYVLLPDGRTQTVRYTADAHGYHAEVSYEGEASYDEPSRHSSASDYRSDTDFHHQRPHGKIDEHHSNEHRGHQVGYHGNDAHLRHRLGGIQRNSNLLSHIGHHSENLHENNHHAYRSHGHLREKHFETDYEPERDEVDGHQGASILSRPQVHYLRNEESDGNVDAYEEGSEEHEHNPFDRSVHGLHKYSSN